MSKTFFLAGFALLSLCFCMTWVPLSDDDTFWHLALGQLLWEGTFPLNAPFTFADPQSDLWQCPSWLFDILLYGLWQSSGMLGLHLFWFLLLSLLGLSLAWPGRHHALAWFLACLWLLSCHFFSALRPHLIALLCFSFSWQCFHRKACLLNTWALALIFFVWQSSHGTWPLFICLMLGLWLEPGFRHRQRRLLLIFCLLLPWFSPGSPLDTLKIILSLESGSAGRTGTEWFSFFDARTLWWSEWSSWSVLLLLFLWVGTSLKQRWSWRLVDVLLVIGLAVVSWHSRRFAPFLSLYVVLSFLHHGVTPFKNRPLYTWLACLLSGSVCALLISNTWYQFRNLPLYFGHGPNRITFPQDACSHLLRNPDVNGQVFNDFDSGGFMVFHTFPQRQPFLTGTTLSAALEKKYRHIVEGESRRSDALMALNCDQVLLGLTWGKYWAMIADLYQGKDYILTFVDHQAMVFTRHDKAQANDRIQAQQRLEQWPTEDADLWTLRAQASTLSACQYYDQAEKAFALALALSPRDATLFFNRGLLHGQTGQWKAAVSDFKQALHWGGDDPELFMHLGNTLAQPMLNQKKEALKYYRLSYDLGYRHQALLHNMILLLKHFQHRAEAQKIEKEYKQLYSKSGH